MKRIKGQIRDIASQYNFGDLIAASVLSVYDCVKGKSTGRLLSFPF